MRTHGAVLVPLALVAALALAGCVPGADGTAPGAPGSDTPGSSGAPGSSSSDAELPADVIPYVAACDQLLPADVLSAYDSEFALVGAFDPAGDSLAAEVAAAGGTLCQWIHSSSNATIDVAVAELPTEVAAAKMEAAGTAVDDFGDNGYFSVNDGVGSAQVFSGPLWVTLVSPVFTDASDAAPLMSALTEVRS